MELKDAATPTEESECAFCGGKDSLTKQHAVPYWLMHEVHADPTVIHSYQLMEISSLLSGSFSFPKVIERDHENVTGFWTCDRCVNGWIHDLETEAIKPFSDLVHLPDSSVSDVLSSVDTLRPDSDVLSMGAFKTVLSCDFAVDEVHVIPEEHYRACGEQRIPNGVSVDLGFCREPSGFRILSGPLGNCEGDMTRCVYRVAFQSGHLIMMVRYTDGPFYDLYPGTISLYPEFRVEEELDIFRDSLEIIAWDVLALTYHNEKASDFYGLLET
ncbi:MAG: hypothetical protein KKE79_06255 [Actinobacteria bacterium]|nr:hypothetical protein [Actinomycetota bacterium]MCG2795537.1 hypothetical protein [Actinomycetes bacterium]MBU4240179.1 hypothetical protein [Actinomycetota bacterium]MBU4301856.1 hypothetical protein [Actinomycetota bacterium]MBU4386419.1 hypothetical protein [Actinomycetota bacterium]